MTEVDRKCSWDLLKIFAEGDWNLLPGDAIVHCFSLFFGWSLWKTRGRVPHHSNTCAFVPFPIWCLLNKLACFWKGLGIVFGITSIGNPGCSANHNFAPSLDSALLSHVQKCRDLWYTKIVQWLSQRGFAQEASDSGGLLSFLSASLWLLFSERFFTEMKYPQFLTDLQGFWNTDVFSVASRSRPHATTRKHVT